MTSPADHVDVAAYVLGALDDTDNAAFECHLAGCHRCQAELDELSGLPALLDQVKGSGLLAGLLGPEDKVLRGVMVDIADARRKRRRTGLLAAAAAAVLIIAGPVITIAATGGSTPAGAEVRQVVNTNNNVSAKISLVPRDYGTEISFDLSGVKGPLNCTLYAVSKTGEKYAVSSWLVSDTGYGVPSSPDPLHVSGTAAVKRSDLKELQFATAPGPDLLDLSL
jgi:Putative zinc-finger